MILTSVPNMVPGTQRMLSKLGVNEGTMARPPAGDGQGQNASLACEHSPLRRLSEQSLHTNRAQRPSGDSTYVRESRCAPSILSISAPGQLNSTTRSAPTVSPLLP